MCGQAPDLEEFDISILPDKCVQDKLKQTVWVTGLQTVVCRSSDTFPSCEAFNLSQALKEGPLTTAVFCCHLE
ncbi:hypothetical protein AOLI_G00147630 [Acnodon oligacanthus]